MSLKSFNNKVYSHLKHFVNNYHEMLKNTNENPLLELISMFKLALPFQKVLQNIID